MIPSSEAQIKVQLWRQKAREGTITQSEMREAIAFLRQDRITASAVSSKSRTAKAKKTVNSDDLLDELENI